MKTGIISFLTICVLTGPAYAAEKPYVAKEAGGEVVVNYEGMEIYFPSKLKDKIEIGRNGDRWYLEANSIEVKYTGSENDSKKSSGYVNLYVYVYPCDINSVGNNIVSDLNDEKRHFNITIEKAVRFNGMVIDHSEIDNQFINYLILNKDSGNCYNFNYSLDTFTGWTPDEIMSSLPQVDQWLKKSIRLFSGVKL